MIAGTATLEELALLTRLEKIRKSGGHADGGDPKAAAEAALGRLGQQIAQRDGISKEKGVAAAIKTELGAQLYGISTGSVAITDEGVALAAIRAIAA
jgi:hypothetical protein